MRTQTASATPAYSVFKGWPSGTPIWPKGPLPFVNTSPRSSDAKPCTLVSLSGNAAGAGGNFDESARFLWRRSLQQHIHVLTFHYVNATEYLTDIKAELNVLKQVCVGP